MASSQPLSTGCFRLLMPLLIRSRLWHSSASKQNESVYIVDCQYGVWANGRGRILNAICHRVFLDKPANQQLSYKQIIMLAPECMCSEYCSASIREYHLILPCNKDVRTSYKVDVHVDDSVLCQKMEL